jgi:hypothetical protein
MEFIIKPTYTRIYFDYDHFEAEQDLMDAFRLWGEYEKVLGPYAVGGYTTDRTISDASDLKLIDKSKLGDKPKFISLHVVFYTVKVLASDLMKITKYAKDEYVDYAFDEHADQTVYKLDTRQVLRHPLSCKTDNKTHHNLPTQGCILDGKKPSMCCATVKGDEKLLTMKDLMTVWPKRRVTESPNVSETGTNLSEHETAPIAKPERQPLADVKKMKRDDIKWDDDLVKWTDEQLLKFLIDTFEPEHANLEKKLPPCGTHHIASNS